MTKISSIFPKNQSPSYKYSVATNITYHFTVNHSCLSTCMESTLKVRFHVIFLVSSSESSTLLWTAAAAKSLQLCPWPHRRQPNRLHLGILQARTLEWVAISFSNAWKWQVKVKSLSHVWLLATPWTAAHQAPPSMGFSRQEYWSGVPSPSLTLDSKDTKARWMNNLAWIHAMKQFKFNMSEHKPELGFPVRSVVKNPPANARDMD